MIYARILVLAAVAAAPASAQEIVTLETRPGVTQSFYLPGMGKQKPQAIALLVPGYIRLRKEEKRFVFASGTFLLRSRNQFILNGILPVILDAPSDVAGKAMEENFRRSAEHAVDVRAVLGEVKKRHPGLPVFLAGDGWSTISVANLARVLEDEIAGAAFAASLFYHGDRLRSPLLLAFNFSALGVPVLFVHHVDDACVASPYSAAAKLSQRFAFALISVNGGLPNKSRFCEPLSAHGFYGKEAETIAAMAGWMLGKPFEKDIR